jgi:hypothetical protein
VEKETATAFLNEHQEILRTLWLKAQDAGESDLVFVWIIEEVPGTDEGQLAANYFPREFALSRMNEHLDEIPEYTRQQLERPAGEGQAWLLLLTPEGMASMRVTFAAMAAGGSA